VTIAQDFERELEVFRQESDAATQFFYCSRGLNLAAVADGDALRALNDNKPFWATTMAALQHATLSTLGRIFDPEVKANHSVTRLLNTMGKDRLLFSRAYLSVRKAHILAGADLERYLDEAYYPTQDDLKAIKREVGTWRTHYENVYRGLRHRVVAHRDAENADQIDELWSKTNVEALEQLLVNLRHMHQTLYDMYFNGMKPRQAQARSSALEMLAQPSEAVQGRPLPERCAKAASDVIDVLAQQFADKPMTREERAFDRQRAYARALMELDSAIALRGHAPA